MKRLLQKFNVGVTVRINITTNIFEKGNYLWTTDLLKVSKVLDTKPVTYRLRDMKDDEILGSFTIYKKLNRWNGSNWKDIKDS